MKKKNHLKNLALLGMTSGIMLASQGQAAVSQNQTEGYYAANRSYQGLTGTRRGNYVSQNNNYEQQTAEGSWAPPSSQEQSPASNCGGSHGCPGQHPPAASCNSREYEIQQPQAYRRQSNPSNQGMNQNQNWNYGHN